MDYRRLFAQGIAGMPARCRRSAARLGPALLFLLLALGVEQSASGPGKLPPDHFPRLWSACMCWLHAEALGNVSTLHVMDAPTGVFSHLLCGPGAHGELQPRLMALPTSLPHKKQRPKHKYSPCTLPAKHLQVLPRQKGRGRRRKETTHGLR